MKKLFTVILILSLCLLLVACGKKSEFNGSPNDIPNTPISIAL